jgi:putative PIN family toxin of toxin-antitoxin system
MRIVIDTNQLIAALVRPPELATFLMAWESARFTVVASSALIAEYLRVIAYPEVTPLIYPELLRTFHSHLLQDIELIEPPETPRICRDPDDDKVIAVAIYGLVDYILTIDNDLLTRPVREKLHQSGINVMDSDTFIQLLDMTKGN